MHPARDAVKACDAEVYASLRDRSVSPAERQSQLQAAVDTHHEPQRGDPRQFQPLLNIIKTEQAVSARNGYRTLPLTNQHVQELLTRAVNACRVAGSAAVELTQIAAATTSSDRTHSGPIEGA